MQTNSPAMFADIETKIPPWVPHEWRQDVVGEWEISFTGDEIEALHRVPREPMSAWSEEGGFVAMGAHGNAWSGDVTPHAAKIMDTWWAPTTREVVFCSVEQDGKTAVMYNCLGGSQDMDPGPAMVIMPGEKKAGDVSTERIIPMFRGSRRLKRLISDRADDITKYLLRLKNGGRVFLSWASSADALSSWPIKYLFFDETDKYPTLVGKETDPITLGEKRVRTFETDYKIFKASTPSRDNGGYIHKELDSCPQIWEWHIRCTHCGDTFRAGAEHLVIPDGATVATLSNGAHKVHLACPCCGAMMNNAERKMATRMGIWVCRKGADLRAPEKVGFHRRAYDCKDVSLDKIGIAYLKKQTGDLSAKIAWANGFESVDFEEELSTRKEDSILLLRDDRPAGLVHPETDILTFSGDTQDKGFWYTVRGWRYGSDLKSWLVRCGYVPSVRFDDFDALDKILTDTYRDQAGRTFRIAYGIIDSQGHRTSEVYEWCKGSGVLAARGAKGRKSQPVTISKQEFFPGTNKPIPGGLLLYNLDTHFHKDMLANKLLIDPSDPGAWVLHSGFSTVQTMLMDKNPEFKVASGLEEYAKQMCVEYRDDYNLWQCPNGKANHLWDCEQQQIALAHYLGFQNKVREKHEQQRPQQQQQPANPTGRPGWFQNRRR